MLRHWCTYRTVYGKQVCRIEIVCQVISRISKYDQRAEYDRFWLKAEVRRRPFKVRFWMNCGPREVRFRSVHTFEASGTVEGQFIEHRAQVHTRTRRSYTGQKSTFDAFSMPNYTPTSICAQSCKKVSIS